MYSFRHTILIIITASTVSVTGCSEVVSQVQAPVQVSLTSYLLISGYYVNISNVSDKTLTDVEVTYVWQGNSRSQRVGTLGPQETKTIDPADVNISVKKHEIIRVGASGYLQKSIDTNTLID